MILQINGHQVLIDDEDFEKANLGKSLFVLPNKMVVISIRINRTSGRHVRLHRRIMGVEHESHLKVQVDHINGNRLDNRKENLRLCTHKQNQWNKPMKSGDYKGVSKNAKLWDARLTTDKICHKFTGFISPRDAAHAYDDFARTYHGEFARLNFP